MATIKDSLTRIFRPTRGNTSLETDAEEMKMDSIGLRVESTMSLTFRGIGWELPRSKVH